MTERYIAFDVETPNSANDRMSAIGITVIEGGVIVDDFYSLVNPEARFDYFNVQLTGITPEMAEKVPTFSELWTELEPLMSGGILIAHNAPFDIGVLAKCLSAYDINWQSVASYACTCAMGRVCYDGLTAQIDYLIVTRKQTFVLECKNLYGNIEINTAGDFIRTVSYGRHTKKEGIYSPITQNRRHLELIKQIRSAEKGNFLTKAIFEKYFDENYRSIVVLANPKTVLYDRYAKKELRQQVIRADQLAEYIRKAISESKAESNSDKDMESLAQFFLGIHGEQKTDYTAKFKETLETQEQAQPTKAEPKHSPVAPAVMPDKQLVCPKCGSAMIRRKATKGPNAGKEFFGCSNYPRCRCIINIQ